MNQTVSSWQNENSYSETKPSHWGAPRGDCRCLCLSGHTLDRNHRIHPEALPWPRSATCTARGRTNEKTAMEAALGHVVRRQARAGLHEARGPERGGRRLRQLGHDRSQRRTGGRWWPTTRRCTRRRTNRTRASTGNSPSCPFSNLRTQQEAYDMVKAMPSTCRNEFRNFRC